ncbi:MULTISPECIES: ShlB/FhaC/HecB family hemolysin secretion/activation protein [Burkholderiaceae]|uniref:Putative activation/secretion signal peptide protein n=1 Tax=Caballeronia sordidicola TaxID=196367 RepID=A0A242MDI3_CABSO|nr:MULTISPECIES: POTRA domain-containing protein [Burkholderiaceae]AME24930.1 sugar transporter [Burkholderia sp. PAMC 26561]OTP69345.1 putative activation/secretion signal peptide protein [Caballeronia sordidicola]
MKIKEWKWTLLAAAVAAHAAQAQTSGQVARPSVAGNPLDALPQVNAPQKPPSVTVDVQTQTPHIQELLARHLTPQKIQIEGAKTIPFDEIAQRFTPLVGKDVTIGELMETANGVTALYKERGYALSFAFVPAQTFEGGVVHITVVEGYVADVKIKGDPGTTEKRIRAIADRIRADRPLKQDTFERYVNVLGLTPGVKIAATVAPPQTTDGATSLELDVDRKPFNFATGIDMNHPGLQGIVSATENGLLGQGETIGASALLPKGRNDQTYFAVNGALPIGTDGFTAKVDASHYYGHPVDNPGLPSFVERTVVNDKVGLSASYPFILSNSRSLVGTAGAYASHDEDRFKNTITGALLGQRSQVRVTTLQLDYTGVDTGTVRRASINVAKAFDVLGASKTAETNIPGVVTINPISLTFVRTGATISQTNEWPYKIGTSIAATGQYSPDSLPTSEQIAFGGQRFALGYQPGEVSGDSGWAASAEVNRPFAIGLAFMKSVTPYVSVDTAHVYLHGGTAKPSRLASVGVGFRVSDAKYYSLDLSLAKPVGDAPVEGNGSRSPRVNATFSYQFN